ncbi:hypothetical protein pb186bvf_013974 [Paramecium bursaria]
MNQNSYLNQLFCKYDQEQTEMKLEQQIDDNLKHSYDRLQVEYVIRNDQSIDFSWVRTQQPIPLDVPIFYFEVKIISKLPNSSICIGISDNIILYNKPLGLLIGSIGYHYDGKICYKGKPLQQKIAPYTSEDVVGVGINQVDKKLFFTLKGVRNGPELPYDFQDNQIYPAISLAGVSIVKFNFGAQPFLFDINQLFAFRKAKIQQEVQQQEVSPYGLHLMIQEYLWSEGYIDTLKIFEDESKLQQTELQETQKLKQISSQEMQYEQEFQEEKQNRNSQELNFSPMTPLQRKMSGLQSPNLAQLQFERKTSAFNLDDQQLQNGNYELIQIAEQAFFKNQFVNQDRQQLLIDIKNGEIIRVINLLRDNLSEFYQLPQIFAALHTQQFIELIKQGQATEAITYGRQHLINCKDVSIQTVDERLNPHSQKVESVLGLIIYDDPQKSMLRGLLSQQQRERLADFINKQLLVYFQFEDESTLEICLKQLIQVCGQVSSRGLFAGEQFQFNI